MQLMVGSALADDFCEPIEAIAELANTNMYTLIQRVNIMLLFCLFIALTRKNNVFKMLKNVGFIPAVFDGCQIFIKIYIIIKI